MEHAVMLNKDLLGIIFQYVNTKTLIRNISVCTYWKKAFKINLWRFNINAFGSNITDEGLKYLSECHTLNISYCDKIEGCRLKYLAGVTTLNYDPFLDVQKHT